MMFDSRFLLTTALALQYCLQAQGFTLNAGIASVRRRITSSVVLQSTPVAEESSDNVVSSLSEEEEKTSSKDSAPIPVPLPPVMQHIADERREFQMNLGRAMDTLRRDMPLILQQKPGTCMRL